MVAELGDVQGRLDDLKRRLREPGTPGAAPSMGADPAIGPEDPPHEKPGPEEGKPRRGLRILRFRPIASARAAVTSARNGRTMPVLVTGDRRDHRSRISGWLFTSACRQLGMGLPLSPAKSPASPSCDPQRDPITLRSAYRHGPEEETSLALG